MRMEDKYQVLRVSGLYMQRWGVNINASISWLHVW
jgi:hypothetical protein